ncbi:mammalian cell entry protein [Rhodococcus sp. 06-462-5]|uniref:MCE family protein n=1 Tax=unclassified Rhodococcus (in: high G+C Gram-positive bacteria) TaxID=192944 RepID=UPI000B9B4949|nr:MULTISPECIES: MCE family protein [unclassified Rhodococcus (in: high G+C Gram-positive bacteria)]OZC75148.1 mammalian cell entry protein [Rhodococcus sp. 06-462-5]OZE67665.1 mammalian cell entry protein [Rhodococcus sp. 02-925g]
MIEAHRRSTTIPLGAAFFVVVALFVGWSVTRYDGTFDDVVRVDLILDSAGNALPQRADVKFRGIVVGHVDSTTTNDGAVVAHLAITPSYASEISSSTTARLLPKTLFGERYVALLDPTGSADPVVDGSVLEQDVSGSAIEVGVLLDGLQPLLEAVPPQDLTSTLGALAQGLSGRGEQLGSTIDRLENIFAQLNVEMPSLRDDIRGVADLVDTYSEALPSLVDALDNLRVTGNTVVERRPATDTLIASLTSSSSTTADFLAANSDDIIGVAADSRELVETLEEYIPTVDCFLDQIVAVTPQIPEVLETDSEFPGIQGTAEFVNPKGRYLPNQDEPRFLDGRGPQCFPSAVPGSGENAPQYPGGSYNDGSYQVPSRNPGPQDAGTTPNDRVFPATPAVYSGSDLEQTTLDVVYANRLGVLPSEIPSWTTALGAPAMRGNQVELK